MKTLCLPLALFACHSLVCAQEEKALLQQGLFAEEAEQNLEEAAGKYEAIIARYDARRHYAVAALFRLAEVRRKQKHNDGAAKLYQRILTEFPESDPQARLSRENLAAMGIVVTPPGQAAPPDPEEERELRRLMMFNANTPARLNEPFRPNEGSNRRIKPLPYAASKGWTRVVTWLLDKGVPADDKPTKQEFRENYRRWPNLNREYPLARAAQNGHVDVCELLLKGGAKVEQAGNILVTAVGENDSAMAEWLIENGADINAVDPTYIEATVSTTRCPFFGSALTVAIARDDKIWVDRLLELGASVNVEGETLSALHVACLKGHAPLVRSLLDLGADPNQPDGGKDRGLSEAEDFRNMRTNSRYWTPLHYAAGNPESVDILLNKGADASLADENGILPVHLAAYLEKPESVKLLLDAGSDANALGRFKSGTDLGPQRTPLHYAVENPESVSTLLDKGADVSLADKHGILPLHLAAHLAKLESVKLLLDAGSDANALGRLKTQTGLGSQRTPLMFASRSWRQSRREVIALLVENGADILASNDDGDTALSVCDTPYFLASLVKTYVYPKLHEQRAITVSVPEAGITFAISTAADETAAPPSFVEALSEWPEGLTMRKLEPQCDWGLPVVRRRDAHEKHTSIEVNIFGSSQYPALQWGDIVEFTAPHLENLPGLRFDSGSLPARPPASVVTALRSSLQKTITLRLPGRPDRQIKLRLGVVVLDPFENEFPDHPRALVYYFDDVAHLWESGREWTAAEVQRSAENGDHLLTFKNGDSDSWPESWRDETVLDGDVISIRGFEDAGGRSDRIQIVNPQSGFVFGFLSCNLIKQYRPRVIIQRQKVFDDAVAQSGSKNLSPFPTLLQFIAASYKPVGKMTGFLASHYRSNPILPKHEVILRRLIDEKSLAGIPQSEVSAALASAARHARSYASSSRVSMGDPSVPAEFSPIRRYNSVLPHPDFSNVRISRLGKDGEGEIIAVNLAQQIEACTDDTPPAECRAADIDLLPGDIVELPVLEDRIGQPWDGFDEATIRFFEKAMTYDFEFKPLDAKEAERRSVRWMAPSFHRTPAGVVAINKRAAPSSMQVEDVVKKRIVVLPRVLAEAWLRDGAIIREYKKKSKPSRGQSILPPGVRYR